MVIVKGKQPTALKVIIYGPEGVGKSTLASQFPDPVFVDIENGTGQLDVARIQKPTSWGMLKGIVEELTKDPQGFKTLVIDSADWADRLAIEDVCAKFNKSSIEDFGYGKGWQFLADEWKRFLDLLQELQNKQNMNVVFVAHSWLRKFELPDEAGSYDRYEMKMEKKSAGILKEWACAMLFTNYRTMVVEVDGKKKAQGGKRVIFSNYHPCWDAKNRHGLKDELDMNIKSLAPMFAAIPAALPASTPEVKTESKPEATAEKKEVPAEKAVEKAVEPKIDGTRPEGIPDKLWDLMIMSGVTGEQVQKAVAKRGHYTVDTPIKSYDPKFINGCLIAAWPQVVKIIESL